MGVCECGCGATTSKGRKFRQGHYMKTAAGISNMTEAKLTNEPSNHGDGYLTVYAGPKQGRKLLHREIMEGIIGRPLLDTEIVHHNDENRGNNDPLNLVLCQSSAEHQALHLKARALRESGHADWRKCSFCKQWDDTANLYVPPGDGVIEHRACGRAYRANRLAKMPPRPPSGKKMTRAGNGQFLWILPHVN